MTAIAEITVSEEGYVSGRFPYCYGRESETARWQELGVRLLDRYLALPEYSRPGPESFDGRGAYGRYLAHIVGVGIPRMERRESG